MNSPTPHRTRRNFLKLLPLALFAGCNATPGDKTEPLLKGFQRFNDWMQEKVFSPTKLAVEYADADTTPLEGFRTNSYDTDEPEIDLANWKLTVGGMVAKPGEYPLSMITSLPARNMNARHVCVEGWSMIPKWTGTPLAGFLDAVGADPTARYLYVECGDEYYTSYDMASARHPQTLLAYQAYGQPLDLGHGAPVRIVMPVKLGYKSAKWLTKMEVTNEKKGGYWEDEGYDWFAGI